MWRRKTESNAHSSRGLTVRIPAGLESFVGLVYGGAVHHDVTRVSILVIVWNSHILSKGQPRLALC
jgi:hypothetical protein